MTHYPIRNMDYYTQHILNDWHRELLPKDAQAIDIDLLDTCPRCYRPLIVFEDTGDAATKATGIVEVVAELASALPILSESRDGELLRAKVLPLSDDQRDKWGSVVDGIVGVWIGPVALYSLCLQARGHHMLKEHNNHWLKQEMYLPSQLHRVATWRGSQERRPVDDSNVLPMKRTDEDSA